MKSSQKVYIKLALTAVICGMAGCSTSSPPAPSSTATATDAPTAAVTTSTASSSATANLDIPTSATLNNAEGAEAFVNYYIQKLNQSLQLPDSKLLPPLSAPGCKSCTALIDTAREYEQKGERYDGTPMEVASMLTEKYSEAEGSVVLVYAQQPTAAVIGTNGSTIRNLPSSKANSAFNVAYSNGWKVASIQSLVGG